MRTRNRTIFLVCVMCPLITLFVLIAGLVPGIQSAPVKTVKIGSSQPLNMSFGVDIKQGLETSVDLINREGGLKVGGEKYKIEMTIYDDKFMAEPGQAAAQRLINIDKVQAIVGTADSPGAAGSLPTVQAAGIPFFANATTEKLLDPKLKYVYATTPSHSIDLYPLILKANPKIKTAVLATQDTETGRSHTEKAVSYLKASGIKILDSLYFPITQKDFTPIATKVASLNPDFFALPGFGGAGDTLALMAKALFDSTWRGAWFVTASPVMKDLMQMCPRGEAEGLYLPLTDFTVLPEPPPLALKMKKAYEEKHGTWREVGPYWSLPVWFYVAVVEKAGSLDPAKIDKAIAKLEIDTPIGKAKMIRRPDLGNNKYVDTMVTQALAQIKGGKTVFINSITIEEAIKEKEKALGFKGQWE